MTNEEKINVQNNIIKDRLAKIKPNKEYKTDEIFKVDELYDKIYDFMRKMNFTRNDVSHFNAFFTPEDIVKDVIKRITINENEDILILEPSAGVGFLVAGILKEYPKAYVNVCEAENKMREFLAHFPRTRLLKQDNFLDVKPNKKYKLIVMNPPFNVAIKGKSGKNRKLASDFVKHAYSMLGNNSRLLSIVPAGKDFNNITNWIEKLQEDDVDVDYDYDDIKKEFKHPKKGGRKQFKEFETGIKTILLRIDTGEVNNIEVNEEIKKVDEKPEPKKQEEVFKEPNENTGMTLQQTINMIKDHNKIYKRKMSKKAILYEAQILHSHDIKKQKEYFDSFIKKPNKETKRAKKPKRQIKIIPKEELKEVYMTDKINKKIDEELKHIKRPY
jgi:hypothetical protein